MSDQFAIDLTRYKTDELASRIAAIVSIPESIRTVVGTAFRAVLLLLVANSAILALGNGPLIEWLLTTAYTLLVAIILGFALGLIRVLHSLLLQSEGVLKITLEISMEATQDFQSIRSGGKRLPGATDIVEHVYERVILPTIETAVSKSLGLVGAPLLWIYRKTLGSSIRFLIIRMKKNSLPADADSKSQGELSEIMSQISDNETTVRRILLNALSHTQSAADMVRKFFLYPLYTAFAVASLLAVVPLGFYWYASR